MKLDGNNNKNKLYISIIVGLLFLCVVGMTFAYFQTQYGSGGKVDLKAKSYSVDELSFDIGEDITINPNQFNFAQGKGNLEGETNASAILQANNKTNLAKMNYYAYVVVTKNEFKYTTSDKKAELVLSVEGPDGVVTTLPDLGNAIDVTDNEGNTFKGFDITEFSGVITLADNKEIEVTSSDNGKKQEDWKIKVTFINLDADQSSNSDKNFNAEMIVENSAHKFTVAEVCKTGSNLTNCIVAMNGKDTDLYHHDGTIVDSNGNVIDAADGSYRYAGANPNNYVCLGETSPCTDDNLYRIIGVFGENNHGVAGQQLVKLIKKSSYGNIAWDSAGTRDWSNASLKTILNYTFITEKLLNVSGAIYDVTWKVSGYNQYNVTPKNFYNYEITSSTSNVVATVGLMYVSDYAFGASQTYWSNNLNSYNVSNNNWLHLSDYEWTITPSSTSSSNVWYVDSTGSISDLRVTNSRQVHPTFYLMNNVEYMGGAGTIDDPIQLAWQDVE